MLRKVKHAQEARQSILDGVNALADAVRVTLGPRGRNVIIENVDSFPSSTKDGVTVARNIELQDPFENLGAQMVRQVAQQTVSNAGDGTTTAVVLAQAMYKEGLKAMAVEVNPVAIKEGMDKALVSVLQSLKQQSQEVSGSAVKNVGLISANGDEEVSDMIATAMDRVGRDGVISVQGKETPEMTLEIVEGMQIERGYISSYFITDQTRNECVLENVNVLLYEKKLKNGRELLPILEQVAKKQESILIVAEDVEGEALVFMTHNAQKGALKACAIKSEGFMDSRVEHLKDLAAMTGATVITEASGRSLAEVSYKDLGKVKKVVVNQFSTMLFEGAGTQEAIKERANQLRKQQEQSVDNDARLVYQKRLARLVSGIAVIKVGGATEIAMKERKDRVEDAMFATRCAVEEGIVPGGGVALVRCVPLLEDLEKRQEDRDVATGVAVVRKAITEPLQRIASNAGRNGQSILEKVREGSGNYGYNARTNTYGDMMDQGVLDPTKVVRTAVQNACSVVSLMLITEAVITFARSVKEDSE